MTGKGGGHSGGKAGFAILRRYYDDPLLGAREAQAGGQGVVAVLDNTVPIELILAAGKFPVLLKPKVGEPTPTADDWIDDTVSPETHAFFESVLAGELDFLELMVLGRGDDKLYYYLKEMYRLGKAPTMPPMFVFDLIPSRRGAVRAYNVRQIEELSALLERVAGVEITDRALRGAIALTDRVRGLQRRLLAQRATGMLTGVDAMIAIGASYFMHPVAYAEALDAYLAELADAGAAAKGPNLLVVTSEPLSHLDLHKRLEGAGARVVAEDDWWGSRAPGEDIPLMGSAREAVLQKAWFDTADPNVYPPEAREAWLLQQAAREDIDGVVFYIPPSDHRFGWDYPRLLAAVTERGKPSLLLRQDVTSAGGAAAIDAAVTPFLGALA